MSIEEQTTSTASEATAKVTSLACRINGWTWQAFPIGMGTGAVYVTLSGVKNHLNALLHIKHVFFFLNIVLFLLNISTLTLQLFCMSCMILCIQFADVLCHVQVFLRQSLRLIKDPVKGIFVPLVVLSFTTIIIGMINYGLGFIYVLFWIYVSLSILVCFPMLMIWFNKPHDLSTFTPAWAFLIFPMMLVGVVASNVLKVIPPEEPRAIGVLLVGYAFQGLGFFMTFFYICIYIIRIMTTGFLEGHQANGAFVAILPLHSLIGETAGEVWYSVSIMSAVMLFGLAVFLFVFGTLPYWFPNVGFISVIRVLADIFDLPGFIVWHSIMVVFICITWAILFFLTLMAFWRGKIFFANPRDVLNDVPTSKLRGVSHRSEDEEKTLDGRHSP
ncbi:voltage-dependent anion channel [Thelephora terrestris]|uniref:Voltage-dependent anion channel n=1 Tax=Thelephora terrestris TaxID=56493 RepID=A0A9P6H4Z9_9AGAM|nr:voltage-dependent anion channel [Thelephora terrestris]